MKRLMLMLAGVFLALPAMQARDFEYEYEGNVVTYTVLDEDAKTCATQERQNVTDALILPAHPKDGDVEFTLLEVGPNSFVQCYNLTSVEIPNSVTSIGESTFKGCANLTSIALPNSLTTIGDDAFSVCRGLTSVVISDSVIEIGDYGFSLCTGLTTVTIPPSVTTLSNTFAGCSNLLEILVS